MMIAVQATINAPVEKVWELYTEPEHVMHWNNASDDWHTPKAQNDLRVGGKFIYRMEAKNTRQGFDFSGTYHEVKKHQKISYSIDDGRKVDVSFTDKENETQIVIRFEVENENSAEIQSQGWQAILDNFKKYVEK